MFRGLAWMYGGRLSEGIGLLEGVRRKHPDDLAAFAALSAAYFQNGNIQKATEICDRIAEVESSRQTPMDDYERLLLAHNTVFVREDLRPLITELDSIIESILVGASRKVRVVVKVTQTGRGRR